MLAYWSCLLVFIAEISSHESLQLHWCNSTCKAVYITRFVHLYAISIFPNFLYPFFLFWETNACSSTHLKLLKFASYELSLLGSLKQTKFPNQALHLSVSFNKPIFLTLPRVTPMAKSQWIIMTKQKCTHKWTNGEKGSDPISCVTGRLIERKVFSDSQTISVSRSLFPLHSPCLPQISGWSCLDEETAGAVSMFSAAFVCPVWMCSHWKM